MPSYLCNIHKSLSATMRKALVKQTRECTISNGFVTTDFASLPNIAAYCLPSMHASQTNIEMEQDALECINALHIQMSEMDMVFLTCLWYSFNIFRSALEGGVFLDPSTMSERSTEAKTISILNFQRLNFLCGTSP